MTNAACASYNYNTHQQLKDQQGILLCYFSPWRILIWVIAFIKSVYLKQSTNWYIIRIHWIYECGGVETLVLFSILKGDHIRIQIYRQESLDTVWKTPYIDDKKMSSLYRLIYRPPEIIKLPGRLVCTNFVSDNAWAKL